MRMKPRRWTSSNTTVTATHDNIKYICVDGNQCKTISSPGIFQILNLTAGVQSLRKKNKVTHIPNKLLTMRAIFYYDSMEYSFLFKTLLVSLA